MKTVGSYEAKTHLPRLVREVEEEGEGFTITRHGKPVARLVPIAKRGRIDKAIIALKKVRKGHLLNGLNVRELREEGRP